MNVFFDVDDTIIASEDLTLRPFVREVFRRLREDGHFVYVWSAKGRRWSDIDEHGLRELVTDCFHKPMDNFRKGLGWMGIEVEPHFVVDDFRDIVEVFGGHTIKPYQVADATDREMERVYDLVVSASRLRGA